MRLRVIKMIKGVRLSILFSLSLHFLFLFLLMRSYHENQIYKKISNLPKEAREPKKFEVTYVNPDRITDQNLKQIVNSEVANKEKVENAKYLSQFDNKTSRETVAKKVDIFYRGAKATASPAKKSKKQKKSSSPLIPKLELGDVGLGPEQLAKIEVAKRIEKSIETNSNQLAKASANNYYIKETALGDITNLNTAEYKYFGFYSRIRMQLEQYWSSELKSKSQSLYKKGRSIASGQELITNLEITIDQTGKIIKVIIVTTSGVQEIDEAAIDAFEKAGPFPNPPSELVSTGEAVLRWGFVVRS